jgi:hypothetical protein
MIFNEDTIIGIHKNGKVICYQDYLQRPYIFRELRSLTPKGVELLIFARELDWTIDASPETLAELNQPGSQSGLTH